jgi:hypothetical protein
MTEKDKSTVLLEHYLKKLKLPTMLREYTAVAAVWGKMVLVDTKVEVKY